MLPGRVFGFKESQTLGGGGSMRREKGKKWYMCKTVTLRLTDHLTGTVSSVEKDNNPGNSHLTDKQTHLPL